MTESHAHSANGDGHWHDLAEHLRAVAELAQEFSRRFGGGEAAYYGGLWHDIGKFDPEFQRYLSGERPRGPEARTTGLPERCWPAGAWGPKRTDNPRPPRGAQSGKGPAGPAQRKGNRQSGDCSAGISQASHPGTGTGEADNHSGIHEKRPSKSGTVAPHDLFRPGRRRLPGYRRALQPGQGGNPGPPTQPRTTLGAIPSTLPQGCTRSVRARQPSPV